MYFPTLPHLPTFLFLLECQHVQNVGKRKAKQAMHTPERQCFRCGRFRFPALEFSTSCFSQDKHIDYHIVTLEQKHVYKLLHTLDNRLKVFVSLLQSWQCWNVSLSQQTSVKSTQQWNFDQLSTAQVPPKDVSIPFLEFHLRGDGMEFWQWNSHLMGKRGNGFCCYRCWTL